MLFRSVSQSRYRASTHNNYCLHCKRMGQRPLDCRVRLQVNMINLMLGDCLERMKEIPDGSVDMVLADPPYGTTACKWDSVIPFEPMWEQLKRVIKPNGAIVLFGSEPFSSALRMSNIKQYVSPATKPS